jgi:tyrosine decarboxylase/aspartate 1-decarboxylase
VEAWGIRRVRSALRAARKKDHSFSSGEILGSMCTAPHAIAAEAHALFLETNLGDPDHFPGTTAIETELLEDFRVLLHAPKKAQARFLTGGTEANIMAMYVAREKTGKTEVVLPEQAHFSFEKAARLLGMTLKWVPSHGGRSHPGEMAKAITKHTALVICVAGSTELGLVDDVRAIGRMAKAAGVPLHVDGAFGGYILPFLNRPSHDLRVAGVWSFSLDPHKVGMSTIPGGILCLRDGSDWDYVAVETPYVSTDKQTQLQGTRPGGAVAAAWAVHRTLGDAGFSKIIDRCMKLSRWLAAGLEKKGYELVAQPDLTVVTFRAENPVALQESLSNAGIRVNVVPRFGAIRIVVNPHVTKAALQKLLDAL